MSGSNSELVVASVALLISAVALTATFMQVLQQYYASASGYSKCSEEVMGGWAESKSRRFSWDELRFVVQFDAPVIFVSPPSNIKGPIPDKVIHFLDGTTKSRNETHTPESRQEKQTPGEDRDETAPGPAKSQTQTGTQLNDLPSQAGSTRLMQSEERIHTANHEQASWLVLLLAVQRMESESWAWQEAQYTKHAPPRPASDRYALPLGPPSLKESHTLTVALQRKRKSWDTMPSAVSRPYATTTMCHLVEIMAALGVYWKEFDRSREKYRAEGNGFVVLGERVSNLGLMFSFQTYGQCSFKHNRVIPLDDVKELCFGYVPTIYRRKAHERRRVTPTDELRDLSYLRMGTRGEIAETLEVIGCNKNTAQYFMDENGKTAHLFPMSFEIVGMLAHTLHIKNSYFTYLPNPTPDRWDERSLSVVSIMESYRTLSQAEATEATQNAVIRRRLAHHMDEILNRHRDVGAGRLLFLKALHAALADTDEILRAKRSELESDKSADSGLQRHRREVVRDVLRSHIQEVLRLLNERDDRALETLSTDVTGAQSVSSTGLGTHGLANNPPSFEQINEASPDDRQHKFMQVYFGVVRPLVVRHARESTNRRAGPGSPRFLHRRASFPSAPPGYGLRARGTGGTQASVAARSDPGTAASSAVPVTAGAVSSGLDGVLGRPPTIEEVVVESDGGDEAGEALASLASEDASHDDIWCVLVFRMVCWLMLHDFNREDIQFSKGELLGSRMPVYIS